MVSDDLVISIFLVTSIFFQLEETKCQGGFVNFVQLDSVVEIQLICSPIRLISSVCNGTTLGPKLFVVRNFQEAVSSANE